MKLHLLIAIMVAGAFLAGAAAVGMGLSGDRSQQRVVEVFGYHGLVVFWIGVVASCAYLYKNRDR